MTASPVPATGDVAGATSPTVAPVAPFAARAVLLLSALVAVGQGVVAATSGYWYDELVTLVIGRGHLDWGAADQPPVAPLLAGLMNAVAPGSALALRLPGILAAAGAVVVAALIARELGGDGRAQTLTALAQATGAWAAVAGHWITPYSLEPVQWLLLVWLLVRWMRVRDDRLLLVFGGTAGIALETKFQVVMLCTALLLAVLGCGPRSLLRRPALWAGAGLAALIGAPTLVWQALNGWPQLALGADVASSVEQQGGRPTLALQLVAYAGLLGVLLGGYGLWQLLAVPRLRAYRFLGVAAVLLFVAVVAAEGRHYYLAGMYGVLAAAGAVGLQHRRGARRLRWVAWPLGALSALVAVAVAAGSVILTDPAEGRAVARAAADAYGSLPPDRRDRTVIIGQSYPVAAFVDGYGTPHLLPQAHSLNRSYGYFAPPAEDADAALYLGSTPPDDLRGSFDRVQPVALDPAGPKDVRVWLLTGRHESWTSMWSRLRHLDVRGR